jgi:hypothetical protein
LYFVLELTLPSTKGVEQQQCIAVQQNTGVPIGVGVCAVSELTSGFLLLCFLSTGVSVLQVQELCSGQHKTLIRSTCELQLEWSYQFSY